jgi:hypothetical protein
MGWSLAKNLPSAQNLDVFKHLILMAWITTHDMVWQYFLTQSSMNNHKILHQYICMFRCFILFDHWNEWTLISFWNWKVQIIGLKPKTCMNLGHTGKCQYCRSHFIKYIAENRSSQHQSLIFIQNINTKVRQDSKWLLFSPPFASFYYKAQGDPVQYSTVILGRFLGSGLQ